MSEIMIGSILPVGTILHSMLTLAQFQLISGPGWVLADGQSVSGSKYHAVTGLSIIPDMRGKVLRAKNNGISGISGNPDGDLSLGSFQDDSFESHNHRNKQIGSGIGNAYFPNNATSNTGYYNESRKDEDGIGIVGDGIPPIENTGGNETRMKNITVNIFIKIN